MAMDKVTVWAVVAKAWVKATEVAKALAMAKEEVAKEWAKEEVAKVWVKVTAWAVVAKVMVKE